MKHLSNFIVRYSKQILLVFTVLALVSACLIPGVSVNSDMSKYLPADSPTKKGMEIMEREFPAASSFNVLLTGLNESEKQEALGYLNGLAHVTGIGYNETEKYNKDGYTLFTVYLDTAPYSKESEAVTKLVKERFPANKPDINGDAAGNTALDSLPLLIGVAFAILLIILVIMCYSWIEPLLFLFTIGVAILLNMGTNIIFGSVSNITNAIASILQLCLSMDYLVMLLNRYRQEKAGGTDKTESMKRAIGGAFKSISASSVTTIVGMLALVFMSFTIGKDLGFVLAKSVFFSLLCVFTVLPALILIFDKTIEKTKKKSLHLKMDKIAHASYRIRYAVPAVFIAVFAISFFLKANVGIAYSMADYYKVNEVFTPDNTFVVLYEKGEEETAANLAEKWEQNPNVISVNSYYTAIGRTLQSLNPAIIENLPEAQKAQMEAGTRQFIGDSYGRIMLITSLPEESKESFEFAKTIKNEARELHGQSFVIGNSVMAYEMSVDYPHESNLITVLSILAIFVVVLIAFRSLSIPVILVALIQCAIFITMSLSSLQNASVYYLPLLIVQCLLLGATVDYGILLTSNYCEARALLPIKEALAAALNNSIHTILTSGSILIAIAGILGAALTGADPAISQILGIIAIGGISASILVTFILPGLLAALDKLVVKKRKEN